ncbi:S46 family peptidase, partial [Myxococcota bacterium]|nr:S46 family peptidase [Myxococcota bacterium]
AGEDPAIAIKATPLIRGPGNRLTNTKGQLEGLVKGGLAATKGKLEAELAAWIDADATRKSTWGGVLDEMAKAQAARAATRDDDADLRELASAARLMGAALTIARMAEERAKPDAERHPDYQERNWKRIKEAQLQLAKSYDPKLDQALFLLAAKRIAARAGGAAILAPVLGKKAPTEDNLRAAIAALYAKTKLGDEKVRVELVEKGTVASLKKSTDPLVKLALVLRPKLQDLEDRDDAFAGQLAVLRPKYIQALRAHAGRDLAPDANGTLRVTYGTVRAYRPAPDAPAHAAFTKLSEVLAKNTGKKPFDAPARLVQAAEAKKLGPYVDAKLGEVPVNFLADLHITGGNSGSATLNARGEITGLVFDGNYEAMASDWVFMPTITRSIHVDLRYVLWLLDAVDGADHLLGELGVTPAIP